jgi:hypothetical protein
VDKLDATGTQTVRVGCCEGEGGARDDLRALVWGQLAAPVCVSDLRQPGSVGQRQLPGGGPDGSQDLRREP